MSEGVKHTIQLIDGENKVSIAVPNDWVKPISEFKIFDAIGVLSKINANELLCKFTVPFLDLPFTGEAGNLKNAAREDMRYAHEDAKKYYSETLDEAVKICVSEYYRSHFENAEYYRLAEENKLMSVDFQDGYCDDTTFFLLGVGEYVGSTKTIQRISILLDMASFNLRKVAEDKDTDEACLIFSALSIYAFHAADRLLTENLNLALDYIVLAKEASKQHLAYAMFHYGQSEPANERKLHAKFMLKRRYSKDPKQAAKSEIKALWLEWQVKPHLYKSKAEFAREMQKLHKDDESEALIKDTKTITDTWIKEWQSEQNTTPVYTA